MLAAYVVQPDVSDPLAALQVGERPDPIPPDGWVRVRVRAASLNHHDLWSLRGVGLPVERMPMILGTDAVGTTDDGREVLVHAVIPSGGWSGDETLDPRRTLLSELHQGTLAEYVVVPEGNLVGKPSDLSFEDASCLPSAWLTAYRMLTKYGLSAGDTVLVQGASGGVASAAIQLGRHLGMRVWVTARTERKQAFALELGADAVFDSGARLPERVDAVIETVGRATWSHSLKALRPGGLVVISGATSGWDPPADLNRIFFLQLRVQGSTMGTQSELAALVDLVVAPGIRPRVWGTYELSAATEAFSALERGEVLGKVVLVP